MRNIETSPNETILNRARQHVAHAGDVWVLGRWLRAIEGIVIRYWPGDKRKTVAYMKINRNIRNSERDLMMTGQVLEEVQNLTYLGSLMIFFLNGSITMCFNVT